MERVRLTNERIAGFTCPSDKQQVFLWDTEAPWLAVRATTGAKSFIFESKLHRRTIRITLGDVRAWALGSVWSGKGDARREIQRGAREEASRLKTIIDQGRDPRKVAADELAAEQAQQYEAAAAEAAKEAAALRRLTTVGEAWEKYTANPPKRNGKPWGERHLFDHKKLMLPARTKDGKTLEAGVLASFATLPLAEVTAEKVSAWLDEETARRPTQAALGYRLLRAFLNWCADRPEYSAIVSTDACTRKVSREHLPKANAKSDSLQREQLRPWFDSVIRIPNRTISAYLQILLLVGCRREELGTLRWENVDFQWNSLTIRDKVEGERTIPMTPHVRKLLLELKARNETKPAPARILRGKRIANDLENWKPSPWVFSSKTAADGRMVEPAIAHRKALAAAGLPPVSLHGLRRSFGSLSEWVEVPVGIVAQIQGHKPSATAEKHYRVRPLDLLRMWHTKIESWILEQAGIKATPEQSGLQVVAAA